MTSKEETDPKKNSLGSRAIVITGCRDNKEFIPLLHEHSRPIVIQTNEDNNSPIKLTILELNEIIKQVNDRNGSHPDVEFIPSLGFPEKIDPSDVSYDDIRLVMDQVVDCTEDEIRAAIAKHGGDVVEAILELLEVDESSV